MAQRLSQDVASQLHLTACILLFVARKFDLNIDKNSNTRFLWGSSLPRRYELMTLQEDIPNGQMLQLCLQSTRDKVYA